MSSIVERVIQDEKERRSNAIDMFRPTEYQEQFLRRFAEDGPVEFLVGGGNRSGKTTCVAVAVASMLLNHPMTMRDGTKLHMRPERWRNEPIKCWVVAFDWRHVGKTIWRVLFKPDLFRVIRDQKTGRWRAWDPSNEQDKGLFKITRPSPPLIRMTNVIDGMTGISWMDKKERQISACTLTDGTRIDRKSTRLNSSHT